MAQFLLKINLGNGAMKNASDIAGALRVVADQLENGFTARRIADIDGNDVGQFQVKMDHPDIIEGS